MTAGLIATLLAAVLAQLLGSVTVLPPVFYALVIGLGIGSIVPSQRLAAGAAFASRQVLRFGVALLGLAITLADIVGLGWITAALTIGALLVSLIAGALLSKALGERREAAIISAAAVAICGASAALAVATIFPKSAAKDQAAARTIAGITVIGTIAMLLYPLLGRLLDMSATQIGVFLGGSIHEVAQAAASGFAVSEDVGKVAAVVKMLRVACLGAVVFGLGLLFRADSAGDGKTPLVPGFLVAFALLAAISSAGVVPAAVKAAAVDLSRWCLLVAIAGVGMRTSFANLLADGPRPLVAMTANSLLLGALMLGGVLLAVA